MKKVLVLGANGMAGHIVKTYFGESSKYKVWGLARTASNSENDILMDVSNLTGLEEEFEKHGFHVVINCIGILNKSAENNPELAVWFNSYLPHLLSSYGIKYNFKVIHISTDCVFSGKEGNYVENSFKNGLDFYAKSKGLGEIINEKDLTFRTSIIGPEIKTNGIGLFHWFMTNRSEVVYGYDKAFWTGITTIELAKAIDAAIEKDLVGLYHLVNNIKIDKYRLLNIFNNVFKNDSVQIKSKSDYKIDKSLKNTRSDFQYTVPSYEEMAKEMKNWMEVHKSMYKQYDF